MRYLVLLALAACSYEDEVEAVLGPGSVCYNPNGGAIYHCVKEAKNYVCVERDAGKRIKCAEGVTPVGQSQTVVVPVPMPAPVYR